MGGILQFYFEPAVKLSYFFWAFNITLGISIYLYAVSFVGSNKSLKRTKRAADWVYRAAIILPIIYFLYYFLFFLINYFYANGLHDYGMSMAFYTEDYLFNFLMLVFGLIFIFVLGVIGFDILDEYNKFSVIRKRRKKENHNE